MKADPSVCWEKFMGYYTCPRCGCNETFEGTELVSEYKPGTTHYLQNDAGLGIGRQTGGKTTHTQVTVTKCQACGEILSDKDFRLTPQEKAAEKKKQQIEERENRDKKRKRTKDLTNILSIIVLAIGLIKMAGDGLTFGGIFMATGAAVVLIWNFFNG